MLRDEEANAMQVRWKHQTLQGVCAAGVHQGLAIFLP